MKKVVGVILLLVGIFLLIQGINLIKENERKNDSFVGKIRNEVDNTYHEQSNEQKAAGYAFLIVGGILILIGLKKLFEPDSPNNSSKSNLKDQTTIDFLSVKLTSLVKQKDYKTGIAVLNKIIALDPTSKEAYFNLACLYSLTENKESFHALSKAVENGYTNFEKIKSYPDLNWVRRQANFQDFVLNGYKIPIANSSTNSQKISVFISEDLVSQIERLGKLKEQGLITEDEFLEQKRKILDSK